MKAPSEESTTNQHKERCKSTFSGLQCCHWQYGSIFIRLAVVASKICEIPRNSLKKSNW